MKSKITFRELLRSGDSDAVIYITGIGVFVLTALSCVIMRLMGLPSFCVINRFTGAYCPGCGGTRAFLALILGHFVKSIILHPFVPYFAVISVIFYFTQTLRFITRGKVRGVHFRNIYLYIGIGLLLLNCIVKNVLHFAGIWDM